MGRRGEERMESGGGVGVRGGWGRGGGEERGKVGRGRRQRGEDCKRGSRGGE